MSILITRKTGFVGMANQLSIYFDGEKFEKIGNKQSLYYTPTREISDFYVKNWVASIKEKSVIGSFMFRKFHFEAPALQVKNGSEIIIKVNKFYYFVLMAAAIYLIYSMDLVASISLIICFGLLIIVGVFSFYDYEIIEPK